MNNYFKKLYIKTADNFYKLLHKNLKNEQKQFIITANPETFMKAEQDEELNKMLLDQNITVVPDGIGIVKAARMLNYDVKERIPGIDIANKLLEYGNELRKTIYLFGAKKEVISSLKEVIKNNYPNLKIIGAKDGYEKDRDKVFKDIIKKEPDIVLVALGIPEQEKLIYKYLDKFKKGIFVGVGGSFDVISGHKKRAPKLFQKLNLEWLYRILKEPKRIKRFYDSNVKFLFKIKKINSNTKNIVNNLFLIICFSYLIIGCIMTIASFKKINYYENRTSYKISVPNIKKIISKEYQDNIELAFSDQIPLSITMKKNYNFIHNLTTKTLVKKFFLNECKNKYISMNTVTTFGCNDNIVYKQSFVADDKQQYDDRIENIKNIISKTDIPVYIYYIEKDTDIDFLTNNKSDIFEYLKSNINSNNIYNFEINNFNEFNNFFYKTDHHWNYKGSYKAYSDLVKILTNDLKIEYNDEICLNQNFSGSKASSSGNSFLYNEEFCVYTFKYPDLNITINGKTKQYGNEQYYIKHPNSNITYGDYYGGDSGEIIFDNKNPSKDNILIFGESYDNAILKLLASHFNKTYSIDLRNYKRENGKIFDYFDYIEKNKIDKILMIGNRDFFRLEEFNLEV